MKTKEILSEIIKEVKLFLSIQRDEETIRFLQVTLIRLEHLLKEKEE